MTDLITRVWNFPESCNDLSNREWTLLVQQARATYMLSRLADKIKTNNLHERINKQIWAHFESAATMSDKVFQNVDLEFSTLNQAFQEENKIGVILKGAAYYALGMSTSRGRTFNDIDILVPKPELKSIENKLWFLGYLPTKMDDYDQQYYREWSHEIPPLQHIKRKTVLDIHHNILPPVGLTKVNIDLLTANKQPLKSYSNLYVFSFESMILHSATHLFHEGEFEKGFRDLIDLELLLQDYVNKHGSIRNIIELATDIGLELPLYYAARYLKLVLNVELPKADINTLDKLAPSKLRLLILDFCFNSTLRPNHSSCKSWKSPIAEFILYMRGHLLRMPIYRLVPHLIKKSLTRFKKLQEDSKQQPFGQQDNN